jgi:ATP-dependent Clp protease ATP-binding subunit ClpC
MADKERAVLKGEFKKAKKLQAEQTRLEAKLEKKHLKEKKHEADGSVPEVDAEVIAEAVSDWTHIPVARLAEAETKKLSRLESELHKRIIGQDEAVSAVSSAIRRGRVGLKDPKRPTGSFLFLGPTGVGKTELSKAVADIVYGSEQNMIRVDMSEYMEKHSVSRMIGSPPGYVGHEEGGQLSEQVRRHPYSVILFDEIEKAHPDVFNVLLQVLDEGRITDSRGRRVDFKNTCIIMTSNAGAKAIVDPKRLGFGAGADEKKDYEAMKSGVMEEVKRLFRPEFLNRIDEIIVFHPLNSTEVEQIVGLLFDDLKKRAETQMRIYLKMTPAVRKHIAGKGFSPKYGARPIKREIQTGIENPIAEMLLRGEIREGDAVTVSLKNNEICFVRK